MLRSRRIVATVMVLAVLAPATVQAAVYTVAAAGGDFTAIQPAIDVAVAGDVVRVHAKPTPYFERLVFPRSGNAVDGFITVEAAADEQPILDGTSVAGEDMILIEDRSWIRVTGLEIRNNLGVSDGSGVRILGAGSHLEIRDNVIHDMRGTSAMGITVYGTAPTPISDLVIDGNQVYDCEPAPSEAITLNGNVSDFVVTNNVVRDVNNIGIDFIGGETDIQPDPTKVARDGVCRGNRVERARSIYGGGFAGGIYVDGGRDIVIANNIVTESDLGIEIGAENPGTVTRGIVVRDNVVYRNDKAGIVFGGFASNTGRVRDSEFANNTCFGNDTLGAGFGELWIQYAEDNVVRNNLFRAAGQPRLLTSDAGNVGNTLDYNLWFADDLGTAVFVWNGSEHIGLGAYQAATGQDAHSLGVDPSLVAPGAGDFHLGAGSPAIDAGDPAFAAALGETDLDGGARVNGPRVDIGADEATTCGDGVTQFPELCDDANPTSGDGCDANCTPTGCGNGIVTTGETCDDGNLANGDCCSVSCAHEPLGSPCDDGDTCSNGDACSMGTCAGLEMPAAGCQAAPSSSLQLKAGVPATKNQLTWKWKKGPAVSLAALGDPTTTTNYALCVYDCTAGVSSIRLRARMPAGGLCRGKPCWRVAGSSGFKYADRDATPDGVTSAVVKAGTAGRSSVSVKAKGALLALPGLPLAQDPSVTVQLRNDAGACFEATYAAPAKRNDPAQFSDALP